MKIIKLNLDSELFSLVLRAVRARESYWAKQALDCRDGRIDPKTALNISERYKALNQILEQAGVSHEKSL